jgi:hypothetical protein
MQPAVDPAGIEPLKMSRSPTGIVFAPLVIGVVIARLTDRATPVDTVTQPV